MTLPLEHLLLRLVVGGRSCRRSPDASGRAMPSCEAHARVQAGLATSESQ